MSEDPLIPPLKPTRGEPSDDLAVSFPTLIVIRVYAMLLDVFSRLGDLAVLAWQPQLLLPYLALWMRDSLDSPYRLRRSFEVTRLLQASGQTFNELMYGETPVHTAVWLFRKAGLGKGGQLVDLGAGRGRTLFAARWLGAGARGVELLPRNVAPAVGPLKHAGAELVVGDATQADLHDATHVFTN